MRVCPSVSTEGKSTREGALSLVLNSVESLNMVKVKIAKNHFKFEFLLMTRAEMNGLDTQFCTENIRSFSI